MFAFVVFVLAVVLAIVCTVIYKDKGKKKQTTIPGPEPVDLQKGNLVDIIACGSLHEFLKRAHGNYGPMVSFWLGPKIDARNLLQALTDVHHYGGEIEVANGVEGHRRYAAYAKCYTQSAANKHYNIYNRFSEELVTNWSSRPKDEHIPLQEQMMLFSIKSILLASFGEEFHEEKMCMDVLAHYNVCLGEVDRRMIGDLFEEGSARAETFYKHKEGFFKIIRDAVYNRMDNRPDEENSYLLIDAAVNLGLPEETMIADLLTVFIGGFHTSAMLMSWSIYYMSLHPDVQEKARAEVLAVVGGEADVTPDMAEKLLYIQMILKESVRIATIGLYAARVQEEDSVLGGHKLPAMTPVIHALGVAAYDPKIFPDPHRFDPERFSIVNEKSRPKFAFEPFGFAGKRKCLGYRFSLTETTVLLVFILRSFRFSLVPNQTVTPEYGIVTKAKEEIWITKQTLD